VIVFDPAISWTGRLVYGLFHHEPVAMGLPITWDAPAGFNASDADYFAAQGAATRIFWRREAPCRGGSAPCVWRYRFKADQSAEAVAGASGSS
jgi:hypothetical protein